MGEFSGYIPGFDDPDDLFTKPEVTKPTATHEHVWISGLAALFLYFAGSAAVVVALLLIFSSSTLGNAQGALGTCLDYFWALVRNIGSLFGVK
jgi:hypothetical protein